MAGSLFQVCTNKNCKDKTPRPIEDFWGYPKNKWCKPCIRLAQKNWVDRNRDKVNKTSRDSYQKNRERRRLLARSRYDPEKSKEERLLRRYGISLKEYRYLLLKQNNLCAICEKEDCNSRSLAVDHCHVTGKIRGLLCVSCNNLLGRAKDSVSTLRRAVKYLEKE